MAAGTTASCWMNSPCFAEQEPGRESATTKPPLGRQGDIAIYKPHYDDKNRALVFLAGPADKEDYFGGKINVFVCGALQSPDKMTPLLGRNAPFVPAVAGGYWHTLQRIEGKEISFMVKDDPRKMLTGIVWLDVTEEEVRGIEKFEFAGNFRKRAAIKVQIGDKVIQAITYVRR